MKVSQYSIVYNIDGNNYVVNTYSGAIGLVDNRIAKKIIDKDNDLSDIDINDSEKLLKNGFLVPDSLDEYGRILFEEQQKIYEKVKNIGFVIAPTLNCNFNCTYCFESNINSIERMSDETEDKVIDFIIHQIQNNDSKKLTISWFGGEPLLETNRIVSISDKLISYCDNNDIQYNAKIITNGYFLDEENCKKLQKCRISFAQITLDGPESIYNKEKKCPNNSYTKVIQNIKTAARYMKISIRLNLKEENYDVIDSWKEELLSNFKNINNINIYLAEVCDDWSDDLPVSGLCQKKYFNTARDIENYFTQNGINSGRAHKLVRNKTNCSLMLKQRCVIGPNGELYRCEHMIGKKDFVIGSCKEGFFHNDADSAFSNLKRPSKCRECRIFPICMSGCASDMVLKKSDRIDCEGYIQTIDEYNKTRIRKLIKK